MPLVVQSCIYDLSYGSATFRPDKAMGYEACLNALKKNNPQSGSIGAGTGATVGKMCGMKQSQKSGISAPTINSIGDKFRFVFFEKCRSGNFAINVARNYLTFSIKDTRNVLTVEMVAMRRIVFANPIRNHQIRGCIQKARLARRLTLYC